MDSNTGGVDLDGPGAVPTTSTPLTDQPASNSVSSPVYPNNRDNSSNPNSIQASPNGNLLQASPHYDSRSASVSNRKEHSATSSISILSTGNPRKTNSNHHGRNCIDSSKLGAYSPTTLVLDPIYKASPSQEECRANLNEDRLGGEEGGNLEMELDIVSFDLSEKLKVVEGDSEDVSGSPGVAGMGA